MIQIEGIDISVLRAATRHRADGMSWQAAADALGVTEHKLRRALDPEYAERKALNVKARREAVRLGAETVPRLTHAEARRVMARVPTDTRTAWSKFMGDPLPGRSALDRRQQ